MNVPRTTKTTILAGVLGLAALAFMSAPAAAHTYTRCDSDGDRCVRIHCDSDGDDCWRDSAYSRSPYYSGYGRWVCDADGDDCHWIYNRPSWGAWWGRGNLGFYYNQGNDYAFRHYRHEDEDEDDDE